MDGHADAMRGPDWRRAPAMSVSPERRRKLVDALQWSALGAFLLLLGIEMALALGWRMQHDTPLLHYVAFLIDRHGFTPYKDVFETSMPGTLLLHLAIGKTLGYSDIAFRALDAVYLSAVLAVTWLLMKPFGRAVALAAVVLFGLVYMGYGPSMSLQRDYVGILPVALVLLIATRPGTPLESPLRWVVIGALFGLSASIKPQLAIGLPALILYGALRLKREQDLPDGARKRTLGALLLKTGALAALGFLPVMALPFLWLWATGGLPAFIDMFSSYLPLHIQLSGDHEMLSGMTRIRYLLGTWRQFGGLGLLLAPAGIGIYLALYESDNRQRAGVVLLLSGMLLLYGVYPALSGQFWDYHWMPFAYFCSLCAAFALVQARPSSAASRRRIVPLLVFLFTLALMARVPGDITRQLAGKAPVPPKDGKVDEIAGFLTTHLQPGDKIQPLDWTGGAIHAALLSNAVVATPYIYDYHFYHHVSTPTIQLMRRRFIERLTAERPRYIIDMYTKPTPKGDDTSTVFPELKTFVERNYRPVQRGNGYVILERQNGTASDSGR